jgi:hypothetical protein
MGQRPGGEQPAREVTRATVADRIAERLAGRLSDAGLAKWAFDSFYAMEIGEASVAPEMDPLLDEALDTLMFGDDADFRLSEEELRALAVRLTATGGS